MLEKVPGFWWDSGLYQIHSLTLKSEKDILVHIACLFCPITGVKFAG
jgi:hypothetical protein